MWCLTFLHLYHSVSRHSSKVSVIDLLMLKAKLEEPWNVSTMVWTCVCLCRASSLLCPSKRSKFHGIGGMTLQDLPPETVLNFHENPQEKSSKRDWFGERIKHISKMTRYIGTIGNPISVVFFGVTIGIDPDIPSFSTSQISDIPSPTGLPGPERHGQTWAARPTWHKHPRSPRTTHDALLWKWENPELPTDR
jgi:hypothetical protein